MWGGHRLGVGRGGVERVISDGQIILTRNGQTIADGQIDLGEVVVEARGELELGGKDHLVWGQGLRVWGLGCGVQG